MVSGGVQGLGCIGLGFRGLGFGSFSFFGPRCTRFDFRVNIGALIVRMGFYTHNNEPTKTVLSTNYLGPYTLHPTPSGK